MNEKLIVISQNCKRLKAHQTTLAIVNFKSSINNFNYCDGFVTAFKAISFNTFNEIRPLSRK